MMQSEYDINSLYQEAQIRWLKPAEVYFILHNHERYQIAQKPPQTPASGSLFLFNRRVLKFFRKDGYEWRRKKDGRAVAEAHERLKVGNSEALNCYYAHGEHNPNFQRRIYWMLDPAFDHIVLVHYRDIKEGKQSNRDITHCLPNSSAFIPSSSSNDTLNPNFSTYITESSELLKHLYTPGSVEVTSESVSKSNGIGTPGDNTSSDYEVKQALRRLEEQLSLGDENVGELDPLYSQIQPADDLELLEFDMKVREQAQPATLHRRTDNNKLERCYGGYVGADDHSNNLMLVKKESGSCRDRGNENSASWKDMLESYESSLSLNSEGTELYSSKGVPCIMQEDPDWPNGSYVNQSSMWLGQEFDAYEDLGYSSGVDVVDSGTEYYKMFDRGQDGTLLAQDVSLTITQKQKFMIREISPEWGYATDTTKVMIVGSFLCDLTESNWGCMFGDIEVPLQIIQEGVLCCEAPSHLPGKVTMCITSRNQVPCSELREFEYREKTLASCVKCNQPQSYNSPEELLLLVRFVQMLLSDSAYKKGDNTKPGIYNSLQSLDAVDDMWSHAIDSILDGAGTSSGTVDWLLQELLKDKLHLWLSSRSGEENPSNPLSKKEQGIIHMVAGLGLEWALNPILSHGVSVNFRDINGWTALHWAARFGREKMVADLIASGAAAGAVTDPNSQDPTGKTPASVAAASGHKGLAGYLSEVALTTHLTSLTLEETKICDGSAQVQDEITMPSIPKPCFATNEDQISLKGSLAAVRNAAQAAARIQAAFRALSFRRRKQKEAAAACVDEYGLVYEDIQGISAMSKLAFGNSRDYSSAALSIQKKYRGWKGRKDFLSFRQKVVKIQAHVRGYQIRKHYKVICWAVGILDKVVLRWRRKGAGLRNFRQESETASDSDDEDILKVFRKQKVDGTVNEAFSRVLSMSNSPDARKQYWRMIERFREAKAELGKTSAIAASDDDEIFLDAYDMDNDLSWTPQNATK